MVNLSTANGPPVSVLLVRTEWSEVKEERGKEKQTQSLAHEKVSLNSMTCLFFILVFFFHCCKSVIFDPVELLQATPTY